MDAMSALGQACNKDTRSYVQARNKDTRIYMYVQARNNDTMN